ncbi:MAG: pyridoxal-phosphate dependent enzyme [Gammaproteobacteria bacterium]|nr:pyridoxal-phosphate dependent enzyme [Gammaproteobacteria bacterium]MDA7972610.1 pyridoxal-phosphate dependent enzyme [Gammaproteobacteria bacterium]CAJ2376787.1 MAG: L-cysteate sulfo-lyase [Arenicellales bacterium IbO2]
MRAAAARAEKILANFPRARLAHTPTAFEKLALPSDAGAEFAGRGFFVKRDDCTGLAMGGNKARQLEFYLGAARAEKCDAVLGTGAGQSNFLRMLAAGAARLGMECHLQFEERVENPNADYRNSGNRLLGEIFGAHAHGYPAGEDEGGADAAMEERADALRRAGRKPFVIPLAPGHAPIGALGYVDAAVELGRQMDGKIDLVVIGSGSGLSHAGLLVGLRLQNIKIPVLGVCVRRAAAAQRERVLLHCGLLAEMLGGVKINEGDVWVDDSALAPGYGAASERVWRDIGMLAARAGLLTDPVYSGKVFSCVFELARRGNLDAFRNIAIVHTGGLPALFAYREKVARAHIMGVSAPRERD